MTDFKACLPLVLAHEGGYVNHPKDPGGATNKGITQRTYDAWRASSGLSPAPVRVISDEEVAAIYRQEYWDNVRGGELPAGLSYAMFDFAVNSGPRRAVRFLQQALGVAVDGALGPKTLAAAKAANAPHIIARLCDARLAWLKTLSHWPTFGRGWGRRVHDVKERALDMAIESEINAARRNIQPRETPTPTKDRKALGLGAALVAAVYSVTLFACKVPILNTIINSCGG